MVLVGCCRIVAACEGVQQFKLQVFKNVGQSMGGDVIPSSTKLRRDIVTLPSVLPFFRNILVNTLESASFRKGDVEPFNGWRT
jgi:hypothetical protein